MRLAFIPLGGVAFLALVLLLFSIAASSPLAALGVIFLGVGAAVSLFLWDPKVKQEGEEAQSTPLPVRQPRPHVVPRALRNLIREAPAGMGLPVLLGRVAGKPPTPSSLNPWTWIDLASAPHVLVGGSTGSGKSVFLNTLIATACARSEPDELGLVVIDPKRVEMGRFANLPHCIKHVTRKPQARWALDGVVCEMDRRYAEMERSGLRDGADKYGRILVVIDEMADLVIPHSKEKAEKDRCESIVALLARLLALGRAAGIHVVLATQSPRREVVTGLIKGNAPLRIAFRTSNKTESRIVLDANGAEALPGKGRGLIVSPQVPNTEKPGTPVEFQGAMLSDGLLDEYCGRA